MNLIEDFRNYLKSLNLSRNTCKNYVSDLQNFVIFLKSQDQYFSILTLPFVLQIEVLEAYKNWLNQRDPLTTANRRLAALRKFIDFVGVQNLASISTTAPIRNLGSSPQQTIPQSNKEPLSVTRHRPWIILPIVMTIIAAAISMYLIKPMTINSRLRGLQEVVSDFIQPKIIDPTL